MIRLGHRWAGRDEIGSYCIRCYMRPWWAGASVRCTGRQATRAADNDPVVSETLRCVEVASDEDARFRLTELTSSCGADGMRRRHFEQ